VGDNHNSVQARSSQEPGFRTDNALHGRSQRWRGVGDSRQALTVAGSLPQRGITLMLPKKIEI
jgi:hypothetical protein